MKIGRRLKWEWAYRRMRRPKRRDLILDEQRIVKELRQGPIPVEEFDIDVAEYRRWRDAAEYERKYPNYYTENLAEKSLEHYVAARLLELKEKETYLDVASQMGVAADIYERIYRVRSLVQDLDFEPGIHGRRIGSNAANMPLADDSIDAMALHCSFEHFEGDSDSGFVKEMARVLRPGGRCVIAPLYLCQFHACLTDPTLSSDVQFDSGAVLVGLRTWPNRHGRFYSPEQLVERVWRHKGPLSMKVLVCRNYAEVDRSCYLRYAALFQKQ